MRLPARSCSSAHISALSMPLGCSFTNQFDAAEARLHDAEARLTPDTPDDLARRGAGQGGAGAGDYPLC